MSDHRWIQDGELGEGWDAMCCTCGWQCGGPLPNCAEAWKQHMIEVWAEAGVRSASHRRRASDE